MTERQKEIVKFKISQIKKALAADKKQWGGYYHDGGGYRYLQPALYLQLQDYKGAKRYFNWFVKNFPEDIGYPIFLFEWTITLYKNNEIQQATRKAFETFMSNTYLFDKFFGKEFLYFEKWEGSNWEMTETADRLPYMSTQEDLKDFALWLDEFATSRLFNEAANQFIDIQTQLKVLAVGKKRSLLINKRANLFRLFD